MKGTIPTTNQSSFKYRCQLTECTNSKFSQLFQRTTLNDSLFQLISFFVLLIDLLRQEVCLGHIQSTSLKNDIGQYIQAVKGEKSSRTNLNLWNWFKRVIIWCVMILWRRTRRTPFEQQNPFQHTFNTTFKQQKLKNQTELYSIYWVCWNVWWWSWKKLNSAVINYSSNIIRGESDYCDTKLAIYWSCNTNIYLMHSKTIEQC
jgi:hypothetical protein